MGNVKKLTIGNNKYDLPSKLSDLSSDSTHRTVTDAQIAAWNTSAGTNAIQEISINGVKQTVVDHKVNLPAYPSKVSELTNDSGFTSNEGTITEVKVNGVSKGTSGIVNIDKVMQEYVISDAGTSANDYTTSGIYSFSSANCPTDLPYTGTTTVLVVYNYISHSKYLKQVCYKLTGNTQETYERRSREVNSDYRWDDWQKVAYASDIPTVPTKISDLVDDVVAGNYMPITVISTPGTNCDDYTNYGMFTHSTANAPVGVPKETAGYLIVYRYSATYVKQLWYCVTTNEQYERTKVSSGWGSWKEIALKENIPTDYISTSVKGSANGVAELDADGKVPSSQLPSYVDDVLEYDSKASFPTTGESGKIYVDKATNLTWRWSGSAYVEISPSIALGETSSTAYRGDRGKVAYSHATDSSKLTTATESGLYKVAATAQGHIAGLTAVTKSDITALGIPAQDTTYSKLSDFTDDIVAGKYLPITTITTANTSCDDYVTNGIYMHNGTNMPIDVPRPGTGIYSGYLVVYNIGSYVKQFWYTNYNNHSYERSKSGSEWGDWYEMASKLDIPTVPTTLSSFTDDSTHRLVTDAEKTTWNDKATTTDITNAINNLDVAKIGSDTEYITSITETNGKISATKKTFPTIPTVPTKLSEFTDDVVSGHYFPTNTISTSGTNCDDYMESGLYVHNSANAPIGIPKADTAGYLVVYRYSSAYAKQLWYKLSTNESYERVRYSTTSGWSSWKEMASKDDIPVVPTKLSDLADDITHRLVTDAEKTTWNDKAEIIKNDFNLVKFPFYNESGYSNAGITYTYDEQGIITANGTATTTSYFYLFNRSLGKYGIEPNKTYTLSLEVENGDASVFFGIYNGSTSIKETALRRVVNKKSKIAFTGWTEDYDGNNLGLYISSGVTLNNCKIKVMVEDGDTTGITYDYYTPPLISTNAFLKLSGGTMTGTLTSRAITPSTNNTYNLGTQTSVFAGIYGRLYGIHDGDAQYGYMNRYTKGTVDTNGLTLLVLGNSTASGVADNASGQINLYSRGASRTAIQPNLSLSANNTITLPTSTGTLALTSDLPKTFDFASVSDVTISSVVYHTYWQVTPTSSNQVYGVAVHPTNGRLYRIYNNKGTYTATNYDANTTYTFNSTYNATTNKAATMADINDNHSCVNLIPPSLYTLPSNPSESTIGWQYNSDGGYTISGKNGSTAVPKTIVNEVTMPTNIPVIRPNTQYVLSFTSTATVPDGVTLKLQEFNSSSTTATVTHIATVDTPIVFTTRTDTTGCSIYFAFAANVGISGNTVVYPMLERGSVAHPFVKGNLNMYVPDNVYVAGSTNMNNQSVSVTVPAYKQNALVIVTSMDNINVLGVTLCGNAQFSCYSRAASDVSSHLITGYQGNNISYSISKATTTSNAKVNIITTRTSLSESQAGAITVSYTIIFY